MSTINFKLCAAVAAAALGLAFTLSPPILAAENSKNPTPLAATGQERTSQDAMKKDCKKIYKHVHRGHPEKGTDQLKLVRVECPTPRA